MVALTLIFVFVLFAAPPPGELLDNAMALTRWLSQPLGEPVSRTMTRAESIFGLGLFVAFLISATNWIDAFLDFRYQYPRRHSNQGDFLAARSNFRRESYRLWRLSAMCTIALSLLHNWAISTLIITFGLLIHAYSEAVNSSLDRLYRIGAQRLFREEREKRRRLLELARQARAAKTIADVDAAAQTARIEVLEAEAEQEHGVSG
jgi:hypothetical protein